MSLFSVKRVASYCRISQIPVLVFFFHRVLLQPLEAALVRTNYKLSEARYSIYYLHVYCNHNYTSQVSILKIKSHMTNKALNPMFTKCFPKIRLFMRTQGHRCLTTRKTFLTFCPPHRFWAWFSLFYPLDKSKLKPIPP